MRSLSDPALAFRDTGLARALLVDLRASAGQLGRNVRFMEVCGTHTVSLFRSGLRGLLPPELTHVSGPGCPVCVTHDREIAALLDLAMQPDVHIATFGDMLRVPGPDGRSLEHARAAGARVDIVYSPLDALRLAEEQPDKLIVFVAVGFETTAPTTAAAVRAAAQRGLANLCFFCCHKRVPPAIDLLLHDPTTAARIDGLLLPGHVATVLGLAPFAFIAHSGRPAVVAGFEAADMIAALDLLTHEMAAGTAGLLNAYGRAVDDAGNPAARALMDAVFETTDAPWRGLGMIPGGGMRLRAQYASFDAVTRLGLVWPEVTPRPGCRCGDILRGLITPPECPLFGTGCTPERPVGPCMVSHEGSCAAWHMHGA